jgi:hypothetical protein
MSVDPQRYRPPAYTVAEFAKAYSLSVAFVYRLWQQGEGPARMKLGSRTLISEAAAVRWCREREIATERAIADSKTKPAT